MAITQTLVSYFQTYGILDFVLPFILVFTIVFAVLQKIKLFGTDSKKFNVVIALVLGLIFVIPHMLGNYPLGYDPVKVLNETLPSISLVAVAAIMLLLLMGIFGTRFAQAAGPLIAVLAIGFVVYIFGSALNLWRGPYDIFSWWSTGTTELMVIILVFGSIVYFITKEPSSPGLKDSFKEIKDVVSSLFERNQ